MAIRGEIQEKKRINLKVPKRYKVIMYNDDFTPMDFVVDILLDIFQKTEEEALSLMYEVHCGSFAVVGIYTYDIAQTKASLAMKRAREEGWPLRVQAEE